MRNIIVILLALLSMSCQAQQKNDMSKGKIKFNTKDLVYIQNIPKSKEILSITVKSSNTQLNTLLFKSILDHNNTRSLNPNNNESDYELLAGWHYSPWHIIEFTTVKGNYSVKLFLGGLGFVTLPNGNRGAVLFDLSELKKEDKKLLSYYKEIKRKALAFGKRFRDEGPIYLSGIVYNIEKETIQINNSYPHPSKEFNENLGIHQYTVKIDNSKVSFWKGDTQVLGTDKWYPKMVVNFIATAESLATQQGAYNATMRLMKGNVLVFPDGLKLEISLFSHKRTFDPEESVEIAYLEISKNQGKEHTEISFLLSKEKDDQGRLITTWGSAKWGEYNIELTDLSYDEYIDIVVTKTK